MTYSPSHEYYGELLLQVHGNHDKISYVVGKSERSNEFIAKAKNDQAKRKKMKREKNGLQFKRVLRQNHMEKSPNTTKAYSTNHLITTNKLS